MKFDTSSSPIIQTLKTEPSLKVNHMPSWIVGREFPRTVKELSEYDVLILSDVEADVFYLYPEFSVSPSLERAPGQAPIADLKFPDRLKVMKQYVEDGGGLMMIGGWLSFQGRHGQGGWRKTPLEEVLPVEMFDIFDDRVETPEGSRLRISQIQHPIVHGIPWDKCPLFLGYNRVKLKTGSILIGTIGEDDPAMATGEFKRGRSMVFMSDCAPHWGLNFVNWKYYKRFWVQAIRWLEGRI